MDPKIELHVHLEGTVRAPRLLRIGRRNGVSLPADTAEDLAAMMRFRDFNHFMEMWVATTAVLRTPDDFREIVVDYAARGRVLWLRLYRGHLHACPRTGRRLVGRGVRRLLRRCPTGRGRNRRGRAPDARHPAGLSDRGCDHDRGYRGAVPRPWGRRCRAGRARSRVSARAVRARVSSCARDGGLGSVPHAGEVAGTASIRGALDILGATRLRHGIRAVDDTELLHELADRGVVCDVCPISNVRTGAVASLAAHPLPIMRAAGVACSISTDDPAMFDTDLGREYEAASALGTSIADAYAGGLQGALCDDATKARLHTLAPTFPNESAP